MKTCYKVVVRLRGKENKVTESISYEVLADDPREAEEAVVLKHRLDWEKEFFFENVQAVFPCNEMSG